MVGTSARRHFVKGSMSNWAENPLTLGAYSAARPGRHSARAIMGQPLGERVFFAGEALAGRYVALVSGAYLSGRKTAAEVVAALGGPRTCSTCDARGIAREKLLEALK
jgi:monoamine oxidase